MDSEDAIIPMGPNGPYSKLIYLVGKDYEGQIDSNFPFVHKSVMVITQCCIGVTEQGLWIRLID